MAAVPVPAVLGRGSSSKALTAASRTTSMRSTLASTAAPRFESLRFTPSGLLGDEEEPLTPIAPGLPRLPTGSRSAGSITPSSSFWGSELSMHGSFTSVERKSDDSRSPVKSGRALSAISDTDGEEGSDIALRATKTRARAAVLDRELVRRMARLVPRSVLRFYCREPRPLADAMATSFTGVVLFVDISGFTVISRRLAEAGSGGVEKLTTLLNAVFGPMTSLIHRLGGDVIKFAGDALIAVWSRQSLSSLNSAEHSSARIHSLSSFTSVASMSATARCAVLAMECALQITRLVATLNASSAAAAPTAALSKTRGRARKKMSGGRRASTTTPARGATLLARMRSRKRKRPAGAGSAGAASATAGGLTSTASASVAPASPSRGGRRRRSLLGGSSLSLSAVSRTSSKTWRNMLGGFDEADAAPSPPASPRTRRLSRRRRASIESEGSTRFGSDFAPGLGRLRSSKSRGSKRGDGSSGARSSVARELLQKHPIRVKVGLGYGVLTGVHTGGVSGRWEYCIVGDPMRQAAHAESMALPGQVILSPEMWQLVLSRRLDADLRVEPVPLSGFVRLLAAPTSLTAGAVADPTQESSDSVRTLVDIADNATKLLGGYMPRAAVERLTGHHDWVAELRRLTILFVGLPGINFFAEPLSSLEDDEAGLLKADQLALMQAVVSTVEEVVLQLEGQVRQFLVDDKGAVLIAAFGLPPLAHENDPERGIRAALGIVDAVDKLQQRAFVGVTTGTVYCGMVGGKSRREYAMVGDNVNMAARLMAHCMKHFGLESGDSFARIREVRILADQACYQASRRRIAYRNHPPIMVKGREEPLPVFQPVRRRLDERADAFGMFPPLTRFPLVGRAKELNAILALLRVCVNSHQERCMRHRNQRSKGHVDDRTVSHDSLASSFGSGDHGADGGEEGKAAGTDVSPTAPMADEAAASAVGADAVGTGTASGLLAVPKAKKRLPTRHSSDPAAIRSPVVIRRPVSFSDTRSSHSGGIGRLVSPRVEYLLSLQSNVHRLGPVPDFFRGRRPSAATVGTAVRSEVTSLLSVGGDESLEGVNLVLLEGAGGSGKGSLLAEVRQVVSRAYTQGELQILWGVADSVSRMSLQGWQLPLLHLFGLQGVKDAATCKQRLLELSLRLQLTRKLQQLFPLLNPLLPEAAALEMTDAMASWSADTREQCLHQLVSHVIRATTRRPSSSKSFYKTLLIVLEDAHWFSKPSWRLLSALARLSTGVCFIVSMRKVDSMPLALRDLRIAPTTAIVPMPLLQRADIEELICQSLNLLGPECLPSTVVDIIESRSQGIAGYVVQYTAALLEEGQITVTDGRCLHTAAGAGTASALRILPFHGIVMGRLDKLPPEAQVVLKASTISGNLITLPLLQALASELDSAAISEALDTLVSSGFLCEADEAEAEAEDTRASSIIAASLTDAPSTRVLQFEAGVVRDVVLASLPFAMRRRLHVRAALWYEELYADRQENVLSLLAHHWELGGQPAKALPYLQLACANSLAARSYREAVDYADRVLDGKDGRPALAVEAGMRPLARSRWFRWRAEAQLNLGHLEAAERALVCALNALGLVLPQSQKAIDRALWSLCMRRRISRLACCCMRQQAADGRSGATATGEEDGSADDSRVAAAQQHVARLLYDLGDLCCSTGKMSLAALCLLRALDVVPPSATGTDAASLLAIQCHAKLATWMMQQGDLESGQRQIYAAQLLAERQLQPVAELLLAQGIQHVDDCEWREANFALKEAARVAEQAGRTRLWERAVIELGWLALHQAHFHAAAALFDLASKSSFSREDSFLFASCLVGNAICLLALGMLRRALDVLSAAEELGSISSRLLKLRLRSTRALVLYQLGETAEALQEAMAASELLTCVSDKVPSRESVLSYALLAEVIFYMLDSLADIEDGEELDSFVASAIMHDSPKRSHSPPGIDGLTSEALRTAVEASGSERRDSAASVATVSVLMSALESALQCCHSKLMKLQKGVQFAAPLEVLVSGMLGVVRGLPDAVVLRLWSEAEALARLASLHHLEWKCVSLKAELVKPAERAVLLRRAQRLQARLMESDRREVEMWERVGDAHDRMQRFLGVVVT